MSNDDLFDKLSEMLYILKDGHVNLSSAKRVSYYDAWYQGYPWNYREKIFCTNTIWVVPAKTTTHRQV